MREYTTFVYKGAHIPLREMPVEPPPRPRLRLQSETVRDLVFEPTDAELAESSAARVMFGHVFMVTDLRDDYIRANLKMREEDAAREDAARENA